jgi:type I protein arginine methyltransferase
MYTVHDFARMAADGVRMDAYARAIARAVKPGSVVVDLGAGTGIFSLLAARAGAKRVHAIDPNPAIFLLPDLARAMGVADRITIHHALSAEVELPERADVIVSDLRGVTPLNADYLTAIRDARARLLRPNGTLVPQADRLFVAFVEAEDMWRWLSRGWEAFDAHDVPSASVRTSIVNAIHHDVAAPLRADDVLTQPAHWGTVDWATHDAPVVEATVQLAPRRAGIAHGLAVWFETQLLDDIGFDTAPGKPSVYSRAFLPLPEPMSIELGDRAKVTLRAHVRGERWAWEGEIVGTDAVRRFRQSTFFGVPTDPAALLRESSAFKPTRSTSADRVRILLDAMDGQRTVAELVELMTARSPGPSSSIEEETRLAISRYGR